MTEPRVLVDHDALLGPVLLELDKIEQEAQQGDTGPTSPVGAFGHGMAGAATRIRTAIVEGSRRAGPVAIAHPERLLLAALLPHVVEWREDNDMGARSVYCPSCLARGEPWGRTPQMTPVREHKPGCALKLALDAARLIPPRR